MSQPVIIAHAGATTAAALATGTRVVRLRRWRVARWLVIIAMAGAWSIRPSALPTEVLYGDGGAAPGAAAVIVPTDSSVTEGGAPVADSLLLTVNWRLLGTLNYRTGTIPPAITQLTGRPVRIPGFIVPLEDLQDKAKEFLLVPYYGACVHTPPPPPNQMVFVELVGGPRSLTLFDPVWVEGELHVERVNSPYGAVSYTMTGQRITSYRER